MSDKILVVEDDPAVARLLEVTLSSAGYSVATAADGLDALEAAERFRPNLVLLDLMLPGMNGLDVCRALRADHRGSGTVVMMVTARTLPADKVNGLSAGADDYITKPFDVDELLARVAGALRRTREATSLHPLTRLPGTARIERELQVRLEAGQEAAVLCAGLDNLAAFNERYGLLRGDELIRFTAGVLCDAVGSASGGFVGHVGSDDFIVLCRPGDAEAISSAATRTFDLNVGRQYDLEDLTKGYVAVHGEDGRLVRFGIVTLSIGLATGGSHADHRELIERATVMRKVAKRQLGSATATWRPRHLRRVVTGPRAR